MKLTQIVKRINDELAGELLTYQELEPFLDAVIDDINHELDTKFPAFSEFSYATYPEHYPDYDFFPDKYIRNVVIKGAAFKWYIMDEEGIQTAQQYGYDYQDALYYMLRDYLEDVPDEFREQHWSSVPSPDNHVAWFPEWVMFNGI